MTATELVEILQTDQAARWRRDQKVSVESYLQLHPIRQADKEAALDLIVGEILLRQATGERPTVDEYQRRFPQYATELQQQFELEELLAAGRGPAKELREEGAARLADDVRSR